jgi:hypothetical protein
VRDGAKVVKGVTLLRTEQAMDDVVGPACGFSSEVKDEKAFKADS